MGNLLPAAVSLPFAGAGIAVMLVRGQILGLGLALLAGFPIAAWLGANYLGLYQNRKMRNEMQRRLRAAREKVTSRRYFVGAATPRHKGLLDPHEDVGYLILHADRLEFFGEKLNINLDRGQVTRVRTRPNPHSFVGLGGWTSIEATLDGSPARLDVELRERDTLLANRLMAKQLRKRLDLWQKESQTGPAEAEPA